jgi:nuclear RNA export factor
MTGSSLLFFHGYPTAYLSQTEPNNMYRGGRGGYNNNNNRGGHGGYGHGNGNFGNNPAQNLQRANEFANANMITVEIQGWNNATPQELVNFLSRKTRIIVSNTNVDQSGRLLMGQVRNMKDAEDLVKCNGMRFAGQALHVKIIDTVGVNNPSVGGGGAKINTIEILRGVLRSRYNAQSKMLDLQSLQNDPTVVSNGLFSNNNMASKFFMALMKVAEQEKFVVESVNMSGNNIDDYSKWVSELALTFPDVKNIALSNNNIKKIAFFEKLKNKFTSLRELIIQGNPLAQDMNAMKEIINIFPRLIIIDGTQVRDEQKLNTILTFPVKSTSMFFENEDLSKIAISFLSTYFKCWDNNRMDLMALYTPQSQFSYQCDSSVISELSVNSATNLWNNYTPHSRNLKRVSNDKSRMSRLSTGPEQISNTFKCLPKSKHSLDTNPDDYSVETVSFPELNGMIITIHGDFEEVDQAEQQFPDLSGSQNNNNRYNRYKSNAANKKGILEKRGFDRVFVVLPGPNGSFIVASDLLCVKQLSTKKTWKAASTTTAPAVLNGQLNAVPAVNSSIPAIVPPASSSTPLNGIPMSTPPPSAGIPNAALSTLPPDVISRLSSQQQALIMKVMQETHLKPEFVVMLCEQSNWDYNTAGVNFTNSKANIPPDAYII